TRDKSPASATPPRTSVGAVRTLPAKAGASETTGADWSAGLRTRATAVVVPVSPSASVAVAANVTSPGAVGVNLNRPAASSVTGWPFIFSVRAVMSARPSAVTTTVTCVPGTTGKPGLTVTVTDGGSGSSHEWTAITWVVVSRPSVARKVMKYSPTWAGPGVHVNAPVAASRLAPSGRSGLEKVSDSPSGSDPCRVKCNWWPTRAVWSDSASTGGRFRFIT